VSDIMGADHLLDALNELGRERPEATDEVRRHIAALTQMIADAAARDWTCAYCDVSFAEPEVCRTHAQACEHNPLVARAKDLQQHVTDLEKSLENAQHEAAQMDAALRVKIPEIEALLSSACVWCGTLAPDATSAEAMRGYVRKHMLVCSGHPMRALERERDAALADNAALLQTVRHLTEGNMMEGIKGATIAKTDPHPGAALLEEHRKALAQVEHLTRQRTHVAGLLGVADNGAYQNDWWAPVRKALARARNEGLEKAAANFDPPSGTTPNSQWAQIARDLASNIRALKEPEQ